MEFDYWDSDFSPTITSIWLARKSSGFGSFLVEPNERKVKIRGKDYRDVTKYCKCQNVADCDIYLDHLKSLTVMLGDLVASNTVI